MGMKPCSPTEPKEKLILLEVPPVNTEPGRRHLDWDEMEEIGKRSRESRRLEKVVWREKRRPSTCSRMWGGQQRRRLEIVLDITFSVVP